MVVTIPEARRVLEGSWPTAQRHVQKLKKGGDPMAQMYPNQLDPATKSDAERILYTREKLEPHTRPWGRLIWRYERLSPPHATLCSIFMALAIFGHHLIPRPF